VETENASLNEEVIVRGSPDHDCYVGGLTRQDEVVIAIEVVVLAEVAVPKVQSVSEAELFRDKVTWTVNGACGLLDQENGGIQQLG
jgi:hypothetical protein